MLIRGKLVFTWVVESGKGKTRVKNKFQDEWRIEKLNEEGLIAVTSPDDDVYHFTPDTYNVANVLFQQYDGKSGDARCQILLDNMEIAEYDVFSMFERDCFSNTPNFEKVIKLFVCYVGKKKVD